MAATGEKRRRKSPILLVDSTQAGLTSFFQGLCGTEELPTTNGVFVPTGRLDVRR